MFNEMYQLRACSKLRDNVESATLYAAAGVPLCPSDVMKVLVVSEKVERHADKMVLHWNDIRSRLLAAEAKACKDPIGKKVRVC